MKINSCLGITFCLIMTMCAMISSAQSLQDTSITGFERFLSYFKTLQLSDSLVNLSAMTPLTEVVEDTIFDEVVEKWAGPIVPFFTQVPMCKFKKNTSWYVLIKNVCRVANIEMLYIDIVGYSVTGVIKSRVLLKVMDAHGGLGPELDEEHLGQGLVLMDCKKIIHKWFDNVPIVGDASHIMIYDIDSLGNINIHSTSK